MIEINKQKETVVILGGGLIKENGKWRTTTFDDRGDNFGISGDRLRVVAVNLLYKENSEMLIVVLGGKGQLKDVLGAHYLSDVLEGELIELGVPANKIIKEKKSGNTFQQLLELIKIINKMNLKNVTIISNKQHLPRIQAMIEYNSDFNKLKKMLINSKLEIKSAEDIVLKYEPEVWSNIIKEAYSSKEMKERIKLEEEGVRQIKEGTYKFK